MTVNHVPTVDEIKQVGDAYSQCPHLRAVFVQYLATKVRDIQRALKEEAYYVCAEECHGLLNADWDTDIDDTCAKDYLLMLRNFAESPWAEDMTNLMIDSAWDSAKRLHEIEILDYLKDAEDAIYRKEHNL